LQTSRPKEGSPRDIVLAKKWFQAYKIATPSTNAAKCIATDDPRLKEK
jgi:hypothetical protein